jgi:uridine kinase
VSRTPLLIGVAGGTGSGKTTLAQRIEAALPNDVTLLEQDSYYRDRSHLSAAERASVNYDEPAALENDLLAAHLAALRSGQAIDSPDYDFATHTRRPEKRAITPSSIIVVEGILLFAVRELRESFDLRIFVDTDDDIRLMRRIRRDIVDRGRDIADIERQYHDTVRPMHLLYVAPSKRFAHLIVPEGGENAEALDVIVGRLRYLVLDATRLASIPPPK